MTSSNLLGTVDSTDDQPTDQAARFHAAPVTICLGNSNAHAVEE